MALHPKNPNNQLSICLKPPFSGAGRQRPRSGLLQSGRQCRVSGRRCRIAQSEWPTVFSNALSVLPFAGCTPVLRYLQIGHSKVSFVLPAKRKKWHGSFRGAVRILRLAFREKEGRRREIRIRLFGRFPAVPVDGVSRYSHATDGQSLSMFYGRLPDSATRLSATHYCRTAGRQPKGTGSTGWIALLQ